MVVRKAVILMTKVDQKYVNITRFCHVDVVNHVVYYVDIVEWERDFEMWVQKMGDVHSEFEFGCPKYQPNGEVIGFDEFVEEVEAYIEAYGIAN
jgi:hypothetical protein